jgi:hypothetical protein
MLVRPGFLFPLLQNVKKAFPLEFFVGDRALEPDFAFPHPDDFPVSSPGAPLDGNFVPHLGRVQAKKDDPVAALTALRHAVSPL